MQDLENDQLKIKFIRLIRQMIYEWRFEDLINLINSKYPSFFMANQNIFYIIMKFRFIKFIVFQHDIQAAKDFYSKTLTSIMKKIYGNKTSSYNKKHFKYQYFLNQINNNNEKYIYFQQHFKSQIHLEKFINLLEKELNKEQGIERNSVIFNITKYNDNNNINKINNKSDKPLFKTEHVNIITYKHENMSEIEDELFKLNLGETKKNIFNIYTTDDKNINKNNVYINSTSSVDIESNSNNINNTNDEFNYNNNYSDISNNNTNPEINNNSNNRIEINQNKLDSKKFLEKNEFSSFDNKEKCNFNSKIRRVNLCKKIVRKFKKYLKLNIKEINYPFWNSFCRENYLPPFKLEDIEFKSFSRIYLNWLFSHEGGIELYNNFLRNKGDEELNNIYINYGINDLEEKNDLKNFFLNFAIFFSNLKNNDNENEVENNNLNNNENNLTYNHFNNEKSFQADCANNYFDNFIHKKENYLSIGSIKEFYNCERDFNRGREAKNYEVFNKALISDSSNSSMENANFDFNINNNNNNSDKEYNYEYNKNYDKINLENYQDGFSINQNNKFHNNNENNNIYPDTYFFGFKNNNNINPSFSHNFFNSNCDKQYENINED